MKKLIPVLFLLFIANSAFSQTKEITTILNRELEKETRFQKENPEEYFREKYDVVKNFNIENQTLSIEIKKKHLYDDGFYTEKQEVDLRKINTIIKDINIIFETELDAVTITRIKQNGEKTVHKTDLFYLHLSAEKENEYLADEIIKAFKSEGYKVEKRYWFD